MLTPWQQHDSRPAQGLLESLLPKALLADKARDSDEIVRRARGQGMQAITPCKASCTQQRAWDKNCDKSRHPIEHLFQRMKVFRRVATRSDKLDERFLGLVHIAATMKWLH